MATAYGNYYTMDFIGGSKSPLELDDHQARVYFSPETKPRGKRRRTSISTHPHHRQPSAGSDSNEELGAQSVEQGLIIRRNGRGGKLRNFFNMPIDIFIEVCYYLTPYDLRRLSLTCKRLRDLLMSKKSRYIWREVLQTVAELPECPSDLNEPQYVRLLFSSECFTPACPGRGTRVDFFHRVRFCISCWNDKMLSGRDVAQRYSLLPFSIRRTVDSCAPLDSIPFSYILASRRSRKQSFYVESVKEAEKKYSEFNGIDRGQDYEDEMKKRFQDRQAIAKSILKWKATQAESRIEEIAAAKQSRFDSIKSKLKEIGLDERDIPLDQKECRDLVYRDQKLTSKVWQSIRPRLESMILQRREERLEEERRALMAERKRSLGELYTQIIENVLGLPTNYLERVPYLPSLEEVWNMPWVQLFLDQDDEALSKEEWCDAVAGTLRWFTLDRWRDFLQSLVGVLEGDASTWSFSYASLAHGDGPSGSRTCGFSGDGVEAMSRDIERLRDRLSLATSAFECNCGLFDTVMWFPEVLRHGLYYHDWTYPQQFLQHLAPFDRRASGLIRSLLRSLRLDPNTVKIAELAEGGNWLCLRCDPQVARYRSFKEIVEHYLGQKEWFDGATEASRMTCRGHLGPLIVDDHDWNEDTPLVRQDDKEARTLMEGLQAAFRAECLGGLGGDSFYTPDDGLRRVSCALCPQNYGPIPDYLPRIRLHVLHKHQKELDPYTDITYQSLGPYPWRI